MYYNAFLYHYIITFFDMRLGTCFRRTGTEYFKGSSSPTKAEDNQHK